MATKPNTVFLDTLKAAPAPLGIFEVEKGDPDSALLAAWNKRQHILSEIEAIGRFYDADDNCPEKMVVFDALESTIPKMPALTARGLLAKLWVTLAHYGGFVTDEETRAESDTIRRADFDAVEAFEDRLDFEQGALFRAIRDLRYWLQFEQVGYLPQRKLEQ
ncbi:MAG: hypothetical protein M3Q19_14555 [Pseudomonadota bacterium]|nr:hypothetical protein [Pseudomonadota bacterium]